MGFSVLGIGEVLWDRLPSGATLGGAPMNFSYHAGALGANSRVLTRIGHDPLGAGVLETLGKINLSADAVQVDKTLPTGFVDITLNDKGVPEYFFPDNVAWDRLAVTPTALAAASQANAVCFGSLAQRHPASRAAIQQLVAATPQQALRIFDINLRQNFYTREVIEQSLKLANILKLNDEELIILAEMFTLPSNTEAQIEYLAETFNLNRIVLTCGTNGSLIYQRGTWSKQLPRPVAVVDTIGAGDAFTAAFTMGLLNKLDLDEAHAFAADLAGFVCSRPGAMPALPDIFLSRQ